MDVGSFSGGVPGQGACLLSCCRGSGADAFCGGPVYVEGFDDLRVIASTDQISQAAVAFGEHGGPDAVFVGRGA